MHSNTHTHTHITMKISDSKRLSRMSPGRTFLPKFISESKHEAIHHGIKMGCDDLMRHTKFKRQSIPAQCTEQAGSCNQHNWQSAEHDAKNWEVHWYPQTSAKTKSLTRMPTTEKAVKERGCTQMPVAKKERTSHKCPGQRKKDQTTNDGGKRKMAALIRQANEKRLP